MTLEFTHIILLLSMAAIMVGLFVKRFKPTGVFAVVVLLLTLMGIIPLQNLLGHMANSSVITIFLLIFITASLKEHYNLLGFLDKIFSGITKPRVFLLGLGTAVAGLSSVVNNTPVVALFIPYIMKWAKRRNLSPSKFLIPLSFAATLGGTITLIGTSTNLVLNGLMISNGFEPFSFVDFLTPGFLVTGTGLLFLASFGYWLLPKHRNLLDEFAQEQRNYILEMRLSKNSPMVNKSVGEADLRNLDGVYLVEIARGEQMISPVSPKEILRADDLLYFAGDTSNVAELINNKTFGLEFPKTEKFELGNELEVVEALVPAMSDLGGKRVKETNFRERYDAAIIAIQRDGERLGGKIGDQVLQYGDLLLLTAGKHFNEKMRTAKNLYSLSSLEYNGKEKSTSKTIFGILLFATIGSIIAGWVPLLLGLLVLQGGLLVLGLADFNKIKKQFNPDLYIILVCAIAFGTALIHTGTADWLTHTFVQNSSGVSPGVLAVGIFVITILLTSFVTNVAAVSIMFPIVAALLPELQMTSTDAFLLLAFGASCSFLTPVSYQTNLMVYGPGGYTVNDFLKIGLPLTILYALICIFYFV